jgi:signal transduction histidine kinase
LGNLVANALKYSPADSPVALTAEGHEAEVVVAVHNQGAPIPPEELPHVFDAWRRGRKSHPESGSAGGLGLGLHITRQIVQAHGGQIQVSSDARSGTTFTVRLPR